MKIDQSAITNRKEYLQKLILEKEKEMTRLPKGHIRVSKHGKSFQYYLCQEKCGNNGRYLPVREKRSAERMILREYDEKIVKEAAEELHILEKLEKYYHRGCVEDVFEKMPPGKQRVIVPVEETQEQFLARWMNYKFPKKEFEEDMPEFYSGRRERMRSKSEVIIANILDKMEIPYIYECPLRLKNGKTIYPDFTIIDVPRRRVVFLEHLGRMDDERYVDMLLWKTQAYEESGYYVGKELFFTSETANRPLNIKLVEEKLRYILSV